MTVCGAFNVLKSSFNCISWKSTGRFQQTLSRAVEISGTGLHSGDVSTVKILPEAAGKGRYFEFLQREEKLVIPAIIDFVRKESPLCTTLSNRGVEVRTVEHLLSALEGTGVDNCRIQICRDLVTEQDSYFVEVPILDGSARPWVEAIQKVGLAVAVDQYGNSVDKKAPYLTDPVHVWKNDSFIAAFPSSRVQLTYGIDFPQVPAIGCQWFSLTQMDNSSYINQIAPSRTFCVYEEVDRMRKAGLIVGGSLDNAIVCSASKGWLNPPLRFEDEACRHKLLDLVGDFSLFGHIGNQGLPVAHVVAYKGGHALHTDFVRHLKSIHNGQ